MPSNVNELNLKNAETQVQKRTNVPSQVLLSQIILFIKFLLLQLRKQSIDLYKHFTR